MNLIQFAMRKFTISPKLFHVLSTINSFSLFSWLSTGEEDGNLHWQYHRCYSEGHGCRIRRFFQFCGSFCVSVHHHPVRQQGFPNSPGSAVQQPCWQVLRYTVCLLLVVVDVLSCVLGLQSKSFLAQQLHYFEGRVKGQPKISFRWFLSCEAALHRCHCVLLRFQFSWWLEEKCKGCACF